MREIIYLNNNDEFVAEENATKIIIRELNDNGILIKETFMVRDNKTCKFDYNHDLNNCDVAFLESFEKDGKKTFHL